MSPENGWEAWGKHVLLELERQSECDENMVKEVSAVRADIAALRSELAQYKEKVSADVAALKVRASLYGLIAGAIPGAIGAILAIVEHFRP